MIFSEPGRTAYDLSFSIAGVPVRVHPMFWLLALLLGYRSTGEQPVLLLLWVVAVFVSILVHELGHVMAFRHYGVSSHVVLHGFGGLAIPSAGRLQGGWPQFFVALAGPLAGFALAGTLFLGLGLAGARPEVGFDGASLIHYEWQPLQAVYLNVLLRSLMFANIYWGLLNLLPIFPLDGGRMAQALLVEFNPWQGARQALVLSMVASIGMALFAYDRQWIIVALFFGYMAYTNYAALQQLGGRGGGRRF